MGAFGIAAAAPIVGPHETIAWDAVIFPVLFGVPGALIAAHRPRHPVGWLMLFVGASFAMSALLNQLLAAGEPPGAEWLAWWVGRGGAALLVPATGLLLLLLPDGHLPSRRWRHPVRALVGLQLAVLTIGSLTAGPAALDETVIGAGGLDNPVGFLPASWNAAITAMIDPLLTLPLLVGLVAVGVRLRRPESVDRAGVVSILVSIAMFVLLVTVPGLVWPDARLWFRLAGAAVLTGAILAAVVRGHFDRIQVVVSHALIYGALTVTVMLAYAFLVAAAARNGYPSPIAELMTAGVAALLLPARGLLQSWLRRAMYGDRGKPARAMRRLSESLSDADSLDAIAAGLARSLQASLRARWTQTEVDEHAGAAGDPNTAAGEPITVTSSKGIEVRIGLPMGRVLRADERSVIESLITHAARSAEIIRLATELETVVRSRGEAPRPELPASPERDVALPALSAREREVMDCVARGLTNAEIAAELFISPITARNHISSILAKLQVSNRTQAVIKFRGLDQ